jgi:hypothetical protein
MHGSAIHARHARSGRRLVALFGLRFGEHRMRLMMSSLLAGCICLAAVADAPAVPWTSAKFPGEQNRAVQGCADNPQKAGDWVCIIIRCEQAGSLSLNFSVAGPEIQGNVELVIDDSTFALSVPASLKSALPLSTRAQAVPNGLLDAMKSGHMILIQGSHLQPPHNQISLENSRKAIERVERECGRPYSGAANFWRRLGRSMGMY